MRSEILDKIEVLIRTGGGSAAQPELKALLGSKPPREWLARLAGLSRRAGMPEVGIRLLNSIVRPPPRSPKRATDPEIAEYAACLIRIGAAAEALTLLIKVDPKKTPESLLFRAHGLFTEWRNAEAIPLLQTYLRSPAIDSYQKLVGQVNLASGLVDARALNEADSLLDEVREETLSKKHFLLFANSLELSAQSAIVKKDWRRAEKFLELAAKHLQGQGAIDELFVLKWRAILALQKRPGKKEKDQLNQVRERARRAGHWETLRDCDLFEASTTLNENMLLHVYFGTPFEAFRHRLFLEFSRPISLPATYLWNLSGSPTSSVWDPFKERGPLKPGQLQQRLIVALTRDFYRPQRMAALHALIYPEEYFNPISAPSRVHQAVKRLRTWLKAHRVPVEVIERKGSYSLSTKKGCQIRISRQLPTASLMEDRLNRLWKHWGSEFFSAPEAQKLLKISGRSSLRLLADATKDGQLARFGASSATRYRFPPGK